jgi:Neuraminidase (sialidase)
MKLSILFLLIPHLALAQLTEPVFFKSKTYDFGEVVESGGNVEYDFTFTNLANRPMRILNVQASCGCTTPGWTKEVVAATGSGFIKVSFDPKGKPGYFNKTLTVTTDVEKNPIVLTIKGNVVDKKSGGDELKVALGNLRLKSNSITLGKVFVNKPAVTQEIKIQNAGTEPLIIKRASTPMHIKVTTPVTLQAGETSMLNLNYDAKALNRYGFIANRIELITTDADSVKSISVYAMAEEFFSTLSAAELTKAPVLLASNYALDFGRVKTGTKSELTVSLQNKGKQPLTIRELQPNCICVTTSLDKKLLQPGEVATMKILLDTKSRAGTQNKSITIYSTDPRNPVQRVMINGFIEN